MAGSILREAATKTRVSPEAGQGAEARRLEAKLRRDMEWQYIKKSPPRNLTRRAD